ncbi:SGNH/GDSL hydrolase family protein [Brachybacterium sp. AOP43-C2-M15]|uniref:SGNH/GDSL hydrolase family protein n=1 Tax=Brachybacterium sp. AOP43-C2-M15 TaxID=3457661 RepID=UPI0040344A29
MTAPSPSTSRTLLFIGDSITDCHRSEDPDGLGSGYVRLIAEHLAEAGTAATVVNRGIGGHKVSDLVARFGPDCLDLGPDLVTVYVGVNDSWHYVQGLDHVSEESFEQDYRWMLGQLAEQVPGAPVVMVLPFVADIDEEAARIHGDLDGKVAIIRRLAQEHGHVLVDLEQVLADALASGLSPAEIAGDGVHPTPAGHRLIADAWLHATGL